METAQYTAFKAGLFAMMDCEGDLTVPDIARYMLMWTDSESKFFTDEEFKTFLELINAFHDFYMEAIK